MLGPNRLLLFDPIGLSCSFAPSARSQLLCARLGLVRGSCRQLWRPNQAVRDLSGVEHSPARHGAASRHHRHYWRSRCAGPSFCCSRLSFARVDCRWCAAIVAGHITGSTRMDILFNNENGPNFLFKNRGDGRFDDVASARGIADGNQNGRGISKCVLRHT